MKKGKDLETVHRDDQKGEMFKTAKRMVKTNQDIVGEQYKRNDDGVLAVSNKDKKIAWKGYYEKLLNTERLWDRNGLSQADTVSSVPHLIDKDRV